MNTVVEPFCVGEEEAWDMFVVGLEEASFFHLIGWKSVIETAFKQKTHYFKAVRAGEIVGVLPLVEIKSRLFGHALISTGFSIGGGVAALDDEAARVLDETALSILKSSGADYLEYRRPARSHPDWVQKQDLYANFSRPILKDLDEDLKQIPRKQRAVVRKALKNEDLAIQIDKSTDEFFALYSLNVRNLGTPVFPKRFFDELLRTFGDNCEILTVTQAGKPLSSVMSFYWRGAVMPYFTGSHFEARRVGSNDLMYWNVMRRASEKGCDTFDFGRSKEGTGPFAFKKNWGFTPEPIVHEFFLKEGTQMPNLNPLNPKYALMVATWKRLPLPVANFIGPLVVRNIG
jgi:FemAB-related protein (PEP-CTERM system-associated)